MPTATPWLYGRRWKVYREGFLARNPLCRFCGMLGLRRAATVVDHIRPHRGDARLFWAKANHQALCRTCHNAEKRRMEKGGPKLLRGCDEHGVPLDARHHWHTNTRGRR
jgi:5-methylcytosine-specific restriction endonuclease McrA